MRRTQLVSILIALLAIAALGVAATTLETTLTTDPDDEINPNWDRLPIGQSQAADIQDDIGDDSGDSEESQDGASDDLTEMAAGEETDDSTGAGAGMGPGTPDPSLVDHLISLFKLLLPLVGLIALGAFIYRYRDNLLAVIEAEPDPEPISEQSVDPEPWPGVDPSNIVDRAWLRMVQRAGPPHPETTTPGECLALARAQESDVEAFESIATAFERVHYAGVPLEEERPRAKEGLRRLEEDDE